MEGKCGSSQVLLPQYPLHAAMLEVIQEGLTRNEFTPSNLAGVNTEIIYQGRAADVLPNPKVETQFLGVDFPGLVYPRLSHAVLEPGPRDTLFCLAHGLFRNRARLFQQHRAQDPYCPVPDCQGAVQDREHIFCSCSRVVEVWLWMRSQLLLLLPNTIGAVGTSNLDFILLQFPKDSKETECVWLLGNYVEFVESNIVSKNKTVKVDHFKGVLRSRLQEMSSRSVVRPQFHIMLFPLFYIFHVCPPLVFLKCDYVS